MLLKDFAEVGGGTETQHLTDLLHRQIGGDQKLRGPFTENFLLFSTGVVL